MPEREPQGVKLLCSKPPWNRPRNSPTIGRGGPSQSDGSNTTDPTSTTGSEVRGEAPVAESIRTAKPFLLSAQNTSTKAIGSTRCASRNTPLLSDQAPSPTPLARIATPLTGCPVESTMRPTTVTRCGTLSEEALTLPPASPGSGCGGDA